MTKWELFQTVLIVSKKKKKSLGVYVFFRGKNGYQGKKRKSLEYK